MGMSKNMRLAFACALLSGGAVVGNAGLQDSEHEKHADRQLETCETSSDCAPAMNRLYRNRSEIHDEADAAMLAGGAASIGLGGVLLLSFGGAARREEDRDGEEPATPKTQVRKFGV